MLECLRVKDSERRTNLSSVELTKLIFKRSMSVNFSGKISYYKIIGLWSTLWSYKCS